MGKCKLFVEKFTLSFTRLIDAFAAIPVHELVYQGLKVISEWLTTSKGCRKLELLSRISVVFLKSSHVYCRFVIHKNPRPIFLGLKILA